MKFGLGVRIRPLTLLLRGSKVTGLRDQFFSPPPKRSIAYL